MNTEELKGLVLKKFYDLKESGDWVSAEHVYEVAPDHKQQVLNACGYLAEDGLIAWNPHTSSRTGLIDFGLGKITSKGIKFINGELHLPASMIVYDHSTHLHNSPGAIVGSGNVQNINIGKIVSAIDSSSANENEKKEAKSLLEKVVGNKVLWTILVTFFGAGSAQ